MAIDPKLMQSLRRVYGNPFDAEGRGDVVSTGVGGLDLIMQGGFNFGSVHECFGLSKTGKSLVMQLAAVHAQQTHPDCIVAILDRENAYDPARTVSIGFDPSRTIIIPSRKIPFVEDAYKAILDTMYMIEASVDGGKEEDVDDESAESVDKTSKGGKSSKGIGRNYRKSKSPHIVFLIDSMPAFAESETYVEDMGRRAKAWHAVFRRLMSALDPRVMILVSNHIIYKPTAYGDGESKTTGIAINYYRDCGIKLTKLWKIYNADGVVIGEWLGAETDKTRRGAMYAATMFPVYFSRTPTTYYSGILPYCYYLGLAELANKTGWEKDRGKKDIWPNYKMCGKSISERDPVAVEAFCKEFKVFDLIKEREAEAYKGVSVDAPVAPIG